MRGNSQTTAASGSLLGMAIHWIKDRVRAGELLAGAWLNLASSDTAEMAGLCGFDWALIDTEHAPLDYPAMNSQLQALARFPTAPIVRIGGNDPLLVKQPLDLGAAGIMCPWVQDPSGAARLVEAMRYPPQGIRGVATTHRACAYGREFNQYFQEVNNQVLAVVQIETPGALAQVDAIAAVEGLDVLFLGPMDMSVSLGVPGQFDHAKMQDAKRRIVAAARAAGKAAGILLGNADQIAPAIESGFTFVACGSDKGAVMNGFSATRERFKRA